MNGIRYDAAVTPEGRLAAIVMQVLYRFQERNRKNGTADIVDYVDMEEALRPFVQKELTKRSLLEVRALREQSRNRMVSREGVLEHELAAIELQIKNTDHFFK